MKTLSKLYSLNLDRLLLSWKQPKQFILMELCLEIAPNNPMGDRHIRRRCTRESRRGCASRSIAGRKVGPRSSAIRWCNLFLLSRVTRIRGVYGRSIVKTFFYPLVFVLYTLEPGLQCSGILSFGSCSQCTSTTSRCQVRFRMLQKGGNSFLPKLTWNLQQLVGTSDVNTLSRRRFAFHRNIILSWTTI